MKKLIMILLLGVFLAPVFGQDKETRNLRTFNKVSVGESIELVIEQGDENVAYIETRGVNPEDVLTEITGSRLKIHMDRGMYFSTDVYIKLIYKEDLEGIKVSSSADLRSNSLIKSDDLLVQVSSSGDAELDVDARSLDIDVSSSGKLDIAGRADRLSIEVSSSGKVNGFDLTCGTVSADLSSSGRAEVTVVDKLVGEASSSGKLTYKGDPDKVLVDTSSSGRVRKY